MRTSSRALFSPEGMAARRRQRLREEAEAALLQPVLPEPPPPLPPHPVEEGDIREGDIRPVGGGRIVTTRQAPTRAQQRRRRTSRWADTPEPPPPPPPPPPHVPLIRRPTGRAGSGRQIIKIHRSDTAGNTPGTLQPGELAVEYASSPPQLWVGVETAIEPTGRKKLTGGKVVVYVADTPPTTDLESGNLWWDSVSGQMFIFYADPTSSQWVLANVPEPGPPGPPGVEGPQGDKGDVGETGGAVEVDVDPPVTSVDGVLWFDSASAQLFIRYDDQWVVANSSPPPPPLGVTDGSDAQTGEIGEYLEAIRDDLAPFCDGSWWHTTGLALPPGDWDIQAHGYTMGTIVNFAIVVDSGMAQGSGWGVSGPSVSLFRGAQWSGPATTSNNMSLTTPVFRWSIDVQTDANLHWLCNAPGATMARVGIRARRVR